MHDDAVFTVGHGVHSVALGPGQQGPRPLYDESETLGAQEGTAGAKRLIK